MMRQSLRHLVLIFFCFLAISSIGQIDIGSSSVLRGFVKNKSGEPLPGATVIPLEQKSASVVTDLDGAFELQLRTNKTWTIRFGGTTTLASGHWSASALLRSCGSA